MEWRIELPPGPWTVGSQCPGADAKRPGSVIGSRFPSAQTLRTGVFIDLREVDDRTLELVGRLDD